MTGQSRTASLAESVANTSSGFIVSLLTWQFVVCPMFGIRTAFVSNLLITAIFTAVSITRNYVWRRVFNRAMLGKDET